MYVERIISVVIKELLLLGIEGSVSMIKVSDKYSLLRVRGENNNYIVKYFNEADCSDEVKRHLLMEKYGINVIKIVNSSFKVIVYEDYEDNVRFRKCKEEDFKRKEFIINLAKWYKKLHSLRDGNFINYGDYFSKGNLVKIINEYKFFDNEAFCYIYNNFDNIKVKLERINNCLIYGGFCLDNLVISEYSNDVFMLDFKGVKKGYRYVDIRSVLEKLDEEGQDLFISEYGKISEEEIVIDEVVNCVIKLYLATLEDHFPDWGKEEVNKVNSGVLLQGVKCLVEWY